ncbi:OmpP1/FadL family transporter [Mesonia sp. K7]|uniref:OmpP1/FadL family transporter n=1 Tax=Mesonia sp. K7 TaxID=2218606 RepID=UPI000DA9F238|nr:transporter [Mesonia sp. K7]PZD78027.1 transporter [Mesonia sp. K7]
MKPIFTLLLVGLSSLSLFSQTTEDALLFSQERLSGSARFIGMGGAFGSLGGDLSALKVNPAGSAIFLHNYATFTLSSETYTNDATFIDNLENRRNNSFNIEQAGAVFVFNNTNEAATINKLAFGITYDMLNGLNRRYNAQGENSTSIASYFEGLANGVPLDYFTPRNGESLQDLYIYLGETRFDNLNISNSELQSAYLGYEAFLFDANDPNNLDNTAYTSNVTGSSFDQFYSHSSRGYNGKLSFNGSIQLYEKLNVGVNLNLHTLYYERTTGFDEIIGNQSEINNIYFQNSLSSVGIGFSTQVGAIANLNDYVRVGATYHSPTWYSISDETTQFLYTYSNEFGEVYADPNVINVYPNYRLKNPGKVTGSLGLVFKQFGLISFDYSYKDYSNTRLSATEGTYDYDAQNQAMETLFTSASTYRLGGEYRYNKWSFRAGYRMEESPYENKDLMSDLNGYSGGIGYDFGEIKLDAAYDYSSQDFQTFASDSGISQPIQIENERHNIILSLSFDF